MATRTAREHGEPDSGVIARARGAARDAAGLQGCRQMVRFGVEFGVAVAGPAGDNDRVRPMPDRALSQPFPDAHTALSSRPAMTPKPHSSAGLPWADQEIEQPPEELKDEIKSTVNPSTETAQLRLMQC